MQGGVLLKAILVTLLMPGSVAGLIPYLILRHSGDVRWPGVSMVTILSLLLGLGGLAVLLHSIWSFALHGRGTLAPIDPPKVLVVRGLYRYTRNPMYLAVMSILLSETLLFGNPFILLYAAAIFAGFHLFVTLYEEPYLRSQFGASYLEYARSVPRWGITIKGTPPR